jgi:cytochrome c oxidase subunit 2
VLLLAALFRHRSAGMEIKRDPPAGSEAFILVSGVAVPAVILAGVFGLTLHTMNQMVPPSLSSEANPLTIEVIGKQWWWDVRYPEHDVITANEIHIPAGEPVRIQLTAADVIHSFWVPELHGKIDLIPGQTNTITIEADEPGEYLGLCAEFCGMQHAHMEFLVIASEADEFARWLDFQQQPEPEPTDLSLRMR